MFLRQTTDQSFRGHSPPSPQEAFEESFWSQASSLHMVNSRLISLAPIVQQQLSPTARVGSAVGLEDSSRPKYKDGNFYVSNPSQVKHLMRLICHPTMAILSSVLLLQHNLLTSSSHFPGLFVLHNPPFGGRRVQKYWSWMAAAAPGAQVGACHAALISSVISIGQLTFEKNVNLGTYFYGDSS